MSMFKTIALPAAFAFAGLMSVQAPAQAYTLATQHPSVCKPYGDSARTGLYSGVTGASNFSGATVSIICPITRPVSVTSGMSVLVDGKAGSGTISCSVYSYNYDGTYLGAVSFSATGDFYRSLYLPKSMVPGYSTQSLYCSMPANAVIRDIELSIA